MTLNANRTTAALSSLLIATSCWIGVAPNQTPTRGTSMQHVVSASTSSIVLM